MLPEGYYYLNSSSKLLEPDIMDYIKGWGLRDMGYKWSRSLGEFL
jgi:hypothetical protein